jgi:hypothetical protein
MPRVLLDEATQKRDRYAQCITDLDSAKFSAALAEDGELVDQIQRLMDAAETKRDQWNDKIKKDEGGQPWVSPF